MKILKLLGEQGSGKTNLLNFISDIKGGAAHIPIIETKLKLFEVLDFIKKNTDVPYLLRVDGFSEKQYQELVDFKKMYPENITLLIAVQQ